MRSGTRDFREPAERSLLAGCALVIALALIACSCDRYPESYAPPSQRPNVEDPERWQRVIYMTDVDAPDHFAAEIFEPLAANWRWTGQRPMVQLRVPAPGGLRYHIEFAIPQETFRSTGPVTLTFLVEGHTLDTKRYAATGAHEFEKDVPPAWISQGGEVHLGAEIDKVLDSAGRKYGFLLIAIGLKRN